MLNITQCDGHCEWECRPSLSAPSLSHTSPHQASQASHQLDCWCQPHSPTHTSEHLTQVFALTGRKGGVVLGTMSARFVACRWERLSWHFDIQPQFLPSRGKFGNKPEYVTAWILISWTLHFNSGKTTFFHPTGQTSFYFRRSLGQDWHENSGLVFVICSQFL